MGDDGGESRWLTTYGDAMTLLLTFFVALLSMSTIEEESFQIAISSFQGAVGIFEAGKTMAPGELMDMGINVYELSEAQTTISEDIPRQIENMMEMEQENATIRQDERGIIIQVTDQLLFDRGQVEITPGGKEFLETVSLLLKAPQFRDRQLRIEGHADNIPPTRYDSNWEISVLRATSVVEYLLENNISSDRLSAVGFGATRPIADNDTEEGRAKNRRVEIVILREDIQTEWFQRRGR